MSQTDRQLQEWMTAWQAPVDTAPPEVDPIVRHVRQRSRLIKITLAGETAVGVVAAPVLLYLAMRGDFVERAAMIALLALTVGAVVMSWWNWRGSARAVSETTAAFLALSRTRTARLRRGITLGWVLLAGEIAVFAPWVAYRLYAIGPAKSPRTQLFSWGLLIVMSIAGAAYLIALQRWARQEEERIDALGRAVGE